MKTFDVFRLPDGNYSAIKHGFNWTPLFFSWIWCFFTAKLYRWGSVCLGVFIIGRLVGTVVIPSHNPSDFFWLILVYSVFEFSFAIWFASNANNFRRNNYTQLGYEILKKHVSASDPYQAISKAREDSNKNNGFKARQEKSFKNLKNSHKDSVKSLKSLQQNNVLSEAEYKAAEVRAEEVYEQQKQLEERQRQLMKQEAAEQVLQEKLNNNLAELKTMYEQGILNSNTYEVAKGRLIRKKKSSN